MLRTELLAPARNLSIGIAAIDSGADAVYIAGPFFGARKDAGNSIEDIAALCSYAHRFGARIFVTVNISLREEEEDELHRQMLEEQAVGVDAFIVRDERIFGWKDITVPLHASTQCAIRTPEEARRYEALGASRLVLERELSMKEVRAIREAVSCELECFVHGALCVCYSGDCRLSEYLDGRSADRGECIQACRSMYDLVDASGKVLARSKALLSLKDLNLLERISEMAEAGICSFKIEGRLKNETYVRNITRLYSNALDDLTRSFPDSYARASFGKVSGGFTPNALKTFNRGYTELYFDGERGKCSSMNAPSYLGTFIGTVAEVTRRKDGTEILLAAPSKADRGDDDRGYFGRGRMSDGDRGDFGRGRMGDGGFSEGYRTGGSVGKGGGRETPELHNGDGFAFVNGSSIVGFRGDVCEWPRIRFKGADGVKPGVKLYRNIDAAFEREAEKNLPKREIGVSLSIAVSGRWKVEIAAVSEDGRRVVSAFNADVEAAENRERAEAMLRGQLSKRSGHYAFEVVSLNVAENAAMPLLSASTINSMRRLIAEDLDALPCGKIPLLNRREGASAGDRANSDIAEKIDARLPGRSSGGLSEKASGVSDKSSSGAISGIREPLMRSRYCIRYELGICPVHQGAEDSGALFLLNNGRRLALRFDCARCEMTVHGTEQ